MRMRMKKKKEKKVAGRPIEVKGTGKRSIAW